MNPDGKGREEEPGGVEGVETLIRMYCMRKKSIFIKRVER